jgi:hypothetical protein
LRASFKVSLVYILAKNGGLVRKGKNLMLVAKTKLVCSQKFGEFGKN